MTMCAFRAGNVVYEAAHQICGKDRFVYVDRYIFDLSDLCFDSFELYLIQVLKFVGWMGHFLF